MKQELAKSLQLPLSKKSKPANMVEVGSGLVLTPCP